MIHISGDPAPDNSLASEIMLRVPPCSIDAETCTLGSMILNPRAIDSVVQITKADYFYRPAHQLIYQALVDMRNAGKGADLVLLKDELERRKQLESVGGVEYLVNLAEGVPSATNAEYYSKIVRDKALLRGLLTSCSEITRDIYDSTEPAAKIIDAAEKRVFEIAQAQIRNGAVPLKDLISRTFERLQTTDGKLITGIGTGYSQLDELTSGFQNGEVTILASRPSMGKSSLLLNLAEYMAISDKNPVAIFSLEMSKEQLTQRMLASHARYDLRSMRRGTISPQDWTQLQLAAGELEVAPIYIDDSPTLDPLQFRAKARRLKAEHNIACVFLDYIQLMNYNGRSDNRQEQVSEISRSIKALAKEIDVPVVCAAQLNRAPVDRATRRPQMSDLRESGSLEQDADAVMLLHNEDYYHIGEDSYMPTGITELILAKQRNGPVGLVKLILQKEFTRFEQCASGDHSTYS